jgi:hypothetical protein
MGFLSTEQVSGMHVLVMFLFGIYLIYPLIELKIFLITLIRLEKYRSSCLISLTVADVVYPHLANTLMETFLRSIVPILRTLDDAVDEAIDSGFNNEQEKEKNQ